MATRTEEGRPLRILTLIDEYTRECLVLKVARRLRSQDILEQLGYLFIYRGLPGFIRSDNGPEFTANGWNDWVFKLCLLNRVVPGRMDTINRLMENLEMSY